MISGYDDGTFRPEEPVSRAQFMKNATAFLKQRQIDEEKRIADKISGLGVDWSGAGTPVDH